MFEASFAASARPADRWARAARAFLVQQVSAASFAIIILALIVASKLWWPPDAALPRYDMLLVACLVIQIVLIAGGWETLEEAKVIFVFHIVGVVMEIFKTAAGAWVYPEESILRWGGVPVFTGFMYSAVGSYIARVWKLSEMTLDRYPPFWTTAVLAVLIYTNFYTHHYVWDWRAALFVATAVLFWRTTAAFRFDTLRLKLPLLLIFGMVGGLIWIAENIATWANVWLYPVQLDGWRMVPLAKLGSWTLLMIVSFVLVSALYRPDLERRPATP